MVVKQTGEKVLLLKYQFSREKDGSGKLFHHGLTELFQFVDNIDSPRLTIFRVPTQAVGIVNKALEIILFQSA